MRFEVFKRDGFACQYCGAHPPAVTLEVDHIVAVANGGESSVDNYLTACMPCNRGKGATPLDSIPLSLTQKAAIVAEREEQMRGYNAIMAERRKRMEIHVEAVNVVYERLVPGYTLSDASRSTVRNFVEKLGVYAVMDAMEQAMINGKPFKYFCGICWNKIRQEQA
jgi:hypothetical protein